MSQQPALTPEFALGLRAFMLDGLRRETVITRKVIAAVPDAKSSHRPDPNARTAQELAWHLATSETYFLNSIADRKFERGGPPQKPESIAEVLAFYDEQVPKGVARIEAMTAEELLTPIAFAGIFNMPAVLYLGFLNNHSIHHRGELATYLRPMGSKCPSIYGGSYDEPFRMPEPAESAA
jgi:uncharacterized damage-inducible protein DinB